MTITAKLLNASTEWGTGKTQCFICEDTFTYSTAIGTTVPALRSKDICTCDAGPGSHRYDCPGLGGDVCPTCTKQITESPRSITEKLEQRLRTLQREAETVQAWLTVQSIEVDTAAAPVTPIDTDTGHESDAA